MAEESGTNAIFREIGNTLTDLGKEVTRTGVTTIRTFLAEKFAATPAGQETIQTFKMREIGRMLPWIIVAILGIFFVGRLAAGR